MSLRNTVDHSVRRSRIACNRPHAKFWRIARRSRYYWEHPKMWQGLGIALITLVAIQLVAQASFINQIYVIGPGVDAVAVGDFNGDGIPDLAVANNNYGQRGATVTVLLGNGDGTFQVAASLDDGPQSIAVGDFNGDGNADIVTRNFTGNQHSILEDDLRAYLGNGDGTFQAPRVSRAGRGGTGVSMVVADFNGDGRLDIAVTVSESIYSRASLTVLLGNGDGTFRVDHSYAVGQGVVSVALGDFNGDGIPDLAVTNSGLSTVSIFLGIGDGTFQAAQSYPAGSYCTSVAAADFNGDGHLDLAVSDYSSKTVNVFLGNGDGTFQAPKNYAAAIYSLAVGDFNGDGRPDLAGITFDSGVIVMIGNGDGSFQAAQSFPAGPSIWAVAVGDFNRDGFSDLAVANYYGGTVTILLNDAVWP